MSKHVGLKNSSATDSSTQNLQDSSLAHGERYHPVSPCDSHVRWIFIVHAAEEQETALMLVGVVPQQIPI